MEKNDQNPAAEKLEVVLVEHIVLMARLDAEGYMKQWTDFCRKGNIDRLSTIGLSYLARLLVDATCKGVGAAMMMQRDGMDTSALADMTGESVDECIARMGGKTAMEHLRNGEKGSNHGGN